MSQAHSEVLGRIERRRRFSVEEKLAIVAEASLPGANLSEIARRHGLFPAQVFKWRRLAALGVIGIAGTSELPAFVAVEVGNGLVSDPAPAARADERAISASLARPRQAPGVMVIDLGGGRRIRVDAQVDAAALSRVLDVLERR
jgi:transposase